nr:PREDICTED: uncharacterized protein LOC109571370 [Bos indicus]
MGGRAGGTRGGGRAGPAQGGGRWKATGHLAQPPAPLPHSSRHLVPPLPVWVWTWCPAIHATVALIWAGPCGRRDPMGRAPVCPSRVVDVPPEAPSCPAWLCAARVLGLDPPSLSRPCSPRSTVTSHPGGRCCLPWAHAVLERRNSPRTPWGWRCHSAHPPPPAWPRGSRVSSPQRGRRWAGQEGAGAVGCPLPRSGSGVGTGSDRDASATFLVVSGTFLRVPTPGLPHGPLLLQSLQDWPGSGFRRSPVLGVLSPHPAGAHSWMACLMIPVPAAGWPPAA